LSQVNIYAFHVKFFAPGNGYIGAAARWAHILPMIYGKLVGAVVTAQTGREPLKIESRAFGDGPFGDHRPIELDRIIHDAGKFANDKIDLADAGCLGRLRVMERDVQNALGNAEFVHQSNHELHE
jgi:hypothetical protein